MVQLSLPGSMDCEEVVTSSAVLNIEDKRSSADMPIEEPHTEEMHMEGA